MHTYSLFTTIFAGEKNSFQKLQVQFWTSRYSVVVLVSRSAQKELTLCSMLLVRWTQTEVGGWSYRGGFQVEQSTLPGTAWEDYENGFGDLNGEFWYGLRNLHCLTAREEVELHIDMVTKKTKTKIWWTYNVPDLQGGRCRRQVQTDRWRGEGQHWEGCYGLPQWNAVQHI